MSKKTRHEPHEEHADESWLLPYADLLTLLLALFLVLYAMSATDARKFEEMSEAFSIALTSGTGILDYNKTESSSSPPDTKDYKSTSPAIPKSSPDQRRAELMRQEQEDLERLKKQLDNYIKNSGLTSELSTQLNHSQLVITIRDNALFPSGEAVVKPEARKLAKAISQMLHKFPDYEIIVSGHTDDVPISNSDVCKGHRLRKESLAVTINERNMAYVSSLSIGESLNFFDHLELSAKEQQIANLILKEIHSRLGFLVNVGLDYLTLSRSAGTLSGGEAP